MFIIGSSKLKLKFNSYLVSALKSYLYCYCNCLKVSDSYEINKFSSFERNKLSIDLFGKTVS